MHRCRWMPLLTVWLALALCGLAQPAADPRQEAAQAELESARQALKDAATPKERDTCQHRIDVLQQQLQNLKRLAALEQRESVAASRQTKPLQQILLEAVSPISTETAEIDAQRDTLTTSLQSLAKQRGALAEQRQAAAGDTEADDDRAAEIEQQLRNLDAEMLSQTLKLDACALNARLGAEAARIRQTLGASEYNPSPTLRLLLKKRRAMQAARDTQAYFTDRGESLKLAREDVTTRQTLIAQRSEQIAADYDILRERYQLERRASVATNAAERTERLRRLSRQLSSTKSEMRLLQPRAGHVEAQLAAVDQALALAQQGRDLLDRELAYLQADYAALRAQYVGKMAALGMCLLIVLLLEVVVEWLLLPRTTRKEHLFLARRLCRYVTVFVMLLVVTVFFFEDLRSIATILGLAAAAAVIALQDLCSSAVGWFVIALSPKIKVGDRVEIDGLVGDIIDIQLLRTTLQECNQWLGCDDHTGRIVIVPNNFIFKHKVFNYAFMHPVIWQKLDVTFTFESPAEATQELLMRVLTEEAKDNLDQFRAGEARLVKRYDLVDTPRDLKLLCHIADSGLTYSLYFPAHYRQTASFRCRLSQRIMTELAKRPDIQLAYPTQRLIPTAEAGGFKVQMAPKA